VSETTVTSKTDESGLALNFEDVTFHKMGDQGEMHVKFEAQKLTKRQTRLLLSFRSKLNWISV
jgi:hypothetical protein